MCDVNEETRMQTTSPLEDLIADVSVCSTCGSDGLSDCVGCLTLPDGSQSKFKPKELEADTKNVKFDAEGRPYRILGGTCSCGGHMDVKFSGDDKLTCYKCGKTMRVRPKEEFVPLDVAANVERHTSPVTKPSNPKDAVGVRKVPTFCVPSTVMMEVGLAMMEGDRKYGMFNYRPIGVLGSVYYDAARRHMEDWKEGVDIDPHSGLHHITKAIASLVVMRDAMIFGSFTDDRPPPAPEGWMEELNAKASDLIDQYPERKDPFTRERCEREGLVDMPPQSTEKS